MKEVEIHFASGREVLNAYWGHLTGGGLTIARDEQTQELQEGQPVSLRVRVASHHWHQGIAVQGKVVRAHSQKAMIAFDVGDSQNRLLTAALSGRYIDTEARVVLTETASNAVTASGQVFELSEDGCCLRLSDAWDESMLDVGTDVALELEGLRVDGCVVWAQARQRWIIFNGAGGGGDDGAGDMIRAYLQAHP